MLHQSLASEREFKDAALKIVGTCEQALSSPRMMMNSLLADAKSQLDRLVAGHERLLLFTPQYEKVHPYLSACITRIELARFQDNQAGDMHGLGGFAGGILGFVADLSTQSEIDYARAYMHDLRIILGASYGSPTAVQDLEDRDARDAGESCGADDATGHYAKPAPQTFSDAQRAISAIGKVTSSNIGDYTINGKVRYGLQSVKLRVTIHPNGATSKVIAEAESDDLWNAGGKSVVNRFLEALDRSNDPTYAPDRQGVSTAKLIGMIALFLVIFLILYSLIIAP